MLDVVSSRRPRRVVDLSAGRLIRPLDVTPQLQVDRRFAQLIVALTVALIVALIVVLTVALTEE
jgi:hypothetical protein